MIDFIDYSDPNNTVIRKDTTIEGNITTLASIEVFGVVNGNLDVENFTSIYGLVNGEVKSRDLILRDYASIKGNVNLFYDGMVKKDSTITGDVKCKNIEISGNIFGSIVAENSVIIRNTGNIVGDITCQSLVVDEGGRINGNVRLLYKFNR